MPRQSRYGNGKQQLTSHFRSHSSTLQSEKKKLSGQAGKRILQRTSSSLHDPSSNDDGQQHHFTTRPRRRRSRGRRLQFGFACRESDANKGISNFVDPSVTHSSSWQHAHLVAVSRKVAKQRKYDSLSAVRVKEEAH